jgi:MoxR-like ATPase
MTDLTATSEIDGAAVADFVERARELERELRKVIVGQHEAVRQVMIALFAGGHVLLEGVPGLGKTLLVKTLGQVLSLRFSRIQFTPDLMPADIVGTTIVSEDLDGRRSLRFQAGPVFANIVLADEVNRATPKTQSALLEAMQEQTVSVGETTRPLPRPFFVLATQNPLEMEGTYPLPEAQLDRFFFKVLVPFPRHAELEEILRRTIRPSEGRQLEPVARSEDVLRMLRVAREVVVAPHLVTYAVRLVLATHPNEGAAPQADCKRWWQVPRFAHCSRTASTFHAKTCKTWRCRRCATG